jgi:hypothetical protein
MLKKHSEDLLKQQKLWKNDTQNEVLMNQLTKKRAADKELAY